ncbi:MAG: winged helix-turn-helix domain-containing protein [Candidatus Bathyarchaeia archaeon]
MNCKEILEFLTEQGLITSVDNNNRRLYKLTENGREILESLDKIRCLLSAAGERRRNLKISPSSNTIYGG